MTDAPVRKIVPVPSVDSAAVEPAAAVTSTVAEKAEPEKAVTQKPLPQKAVPVAPSTATPRTATPRTATPRTATPSTATPVPVTPSTVPVTAASVSSSPGQPAAVTAVVVPQRSADEIEAGLDATRARLAGRLDDLQEYVAPKNVLDRQLTKAKRVFVDEYGGIKPDRVLVAAGVVAVVLGLRILRRRRRRA